MAMIMNASALLPLAKSTGRCPPTLIRDEAVKDGGIFELATLKSLDPTSQGEFGAENSCGGERGAGDGPGNGPHGIWRGKLDRIASRMRPSGAPSRAVGEGGVGRH